MPRLYAPLLHLHHHEQFSIIMGYAVVGKTFINFPIIIFFLTGILVDKNLTRFAPIEWTTPVESRCYCYHGWCTCISGGNRCSRGPLPPGGQVRESAPSRRRRRGAALPGAAAPAGGQPPPRAARSWSASTALPRI